MTSKVIEQLRKQAEELAKSGSPSTHEILKLVEDLKKASEFSAARRLLAQVRPRMSESHSERVALAQTHALCTYKDVNLQPDKRFRLALDILESIGLRDPECRDAETLGQGGAIYKRMWESGGQIEHLHTALAFYRSGWERDAERDLGWGGVNAAYLLDLLAFRERASASRTGTEPALARRWEEQARELRGDLLARLPAIIERRGKSNDYWALATLAEIYFGLEDYAAAGNWLEMAQATRPDDWMRQTTAKQLVGLARLHRVAPPASEKTSAQWHEAWQALYRLLGEDTAAALESWRGKVGLALSGGGFRAALFHLGVLARLAECDMLRSVETLSTVSGGSILGAHYYLELRHLLQTCPDASLKRDDYVGLVGRLIAATVDGVQENLRMRALGNLWANLKMVFSRGYSRSMRMGELYQEYLFDQVKDGEDDGRLRRLRCLLVQPAVSGASADSGAGFKPRTGNWSRCTKVPNLMLNTSSLNSGHNWHFTASWMGEPPGLTGDEIDMNERYRRLYYKQAPSEALRDYPLAYAVAASSCVPAMFEPLPLNGLYPGRTVRLVDGGVHDNQGVAGLLDDDCSFILCSDASGQMDSQADPANGMLGAFWRADNILQDRVREAQYRDMKARADSGALQGLFFVHLKQELESAPIDWIGCDDPVVELPVSTCTSYGVDREIQRLLSEIRTDLDTFTEVESYALMASGYLLTAHQLRALDREYQASCLPGAWGGFDVDAPMWRDAQGGEYWPFAPLIPLLGKAPGSSDQRRRDLAVQLKAGNIMFGRVWHLVKWLRYAAYLLGAGAFLGGGCWVWRHWGDSYSWSIEMRVGAFMFTVALFLAGVLFPLTKFLIPRKATKSVLLNTGIALAGWVVSNLHLLIFDRMLKQRGKLERLLKLPAGD